MKKSLFFIFAIWFAILGVGCSEKFDDTQIWDKLNDHEKRIAVVEELCKQMNTNIDALQTIVEVLEKKDYVTNVTPIREDGKIVGYTISFAKSDSITIYNGKDGVNGVDGYAPKVGVMKDTDGVYYWIVDGEWLLDNKGNKIKAIGVDGENGVTPRLKIENDYWYVSYDEEETWIKLGDAINGNFIFKNVTLEDGFVVFTLDDDSNSQIKLPFVIGSQLSVNVATAGTLRDCLTVEEQRSVISLKVTGYINEDDLVFINTYLHYLEVLDISDAIYISNYGFDVTINPLGELAVNRSIRRVIVGSVLGRNGTNEQTIGGAVVNPSYCIALETLTLTANDSRISEYAVGNSSSIFGCPNLYKLVISEGVTNMAIGSDASSSQIYCISPVVELPSTIEKIGYRTFGSYKRSIIVCRALIPPRIYLPPGYYSDGYRSEPTLYDSFYSAYGKVEEMTLYVPAESVDVYKSTPGWSKFGAILPIEE